MLKLFKEKHFFAISAHFQILKEYNGKWVLSLFLKRNKKTLHRVYGYYKFHSFRLLSFEGTWQRPDFSHCGFGTMTHRAIPQ